jgi:nucleotide-binding universal stress UspA family protein
MKVLIGYDGSQCSDEAIADLVRAGLPADTEALVVSVTDLSEAHPPCGSEQLPAKAAAVIAADVERVKAVAERAMTDARKLAEQAAARIREKFPQWRVRTEARANAPHWGLVGAAAERGADLVVVGSHGRSALGKLLLGSVSQMVLHHAPCSVRIARCPMNRKRPGDPRVRLVLGVDGSADSAAAASAVAARRWPAGSEVLVLGVVDARVVLAYLESGAPQWPPGYVNTRASSELCELLTGVCEDLRRSGLEATASLPSGDPTRALLRAAERTGADCIVIGAKGHSRVERLLLGSVSAAVAARAHCSVEVVRSGAR